MLLPRYAAGTLGVEQVEAVQTHLATGCSTCLKDMYRLPVGLPRDTPVTSPAASPAARTTRPPTPVPQASLPALSPARLLAGSIGVAILLCVFFIWRDARHTQATQLVSQLEQLRTEQGQIVELLEELANAPGGIQALSLTPAAADPGAHGMTLWNASRSGLVLVIKGLHVAAAGERYNAQVTLGGGTAARVTFTVSAGGDAIVPLRLPGQAARFNNIAIADESSGAVHLTGPLRADGSAAVPRVPPVMATGTPPRR